MQVLWQEISGTKAGNPKKMQSVRQRNGADVYLRAQEIPLQKESPQNETHFQEKEMFNMQQSGS